MLSASQTTKANVVKFGMDDIPDSVTGKALDKSLDLLTAGKDKFKRLAQYKNMSPKMRVGQNLLRTASTPAAAERAREVFLEAESVSGPKTHKSHAFRHAAIAAKQAGDLGAARAHMRDAKEARQQAAGYSYSWSDGPKRDIEDMDDETNFLANKVAQPLKDSVAGLMGAAVAVTMFPLAILEKIVRPDADSFDKVKELGSDTIEAVRYAASPYQKERDAAAEALTSQFGELAGESSDEEWINGRDRKAEGRSTGKGLRHRYV